jgi:2-oxo-4-hydroxy-4-carboxy--5-ureidoimidazoline (OHCU) decarboxylase
MSKVSVKRRKFQIKLKRKRKQKIKNLKERYLEEKSSQEKKKILEKIKKIAPHYPDEQILKLTQKK